MKIVKVEISLQSDLSIQESNFFWDEFLADAIEANALQYGSLEFGYIEPVHKDDRIDQETISRVSNWLEQRKEVSGFRLALIDDHG